jgi:hypothetical protein
VIVEAHLFFAGISLLIVLILVLMRPVERQCEVVSWLDGEGIGLEKWDSASLELGVRIFSSLDMDFVARGTSKQFQRRFRRERTALALEWLAQIRRGVDDAMRAYVKAARLNKDLTVSVEVKLALEYLFFQAANRVLYCTVWVHGPLAGANLVKYSTGLAIKLMNLLQVVPAAGEVIVEIVKDDTEHSVAL